MKDEKKLQGVRQGQTKRWPEVDSPPASSPYFTLHGYNVLGAFWVPGEVMSSKNSKQIINIKTKGGKSRPALIDSSGYNGYKKSTVDYWQLGATSFKSLVESNNIVGPIKICIEFYRKTNRSFDHHNMVQGPADLMQKYGWIENDDINTLHIFPIGAKVCKKNPGMIIYLLG